ncbi:redox-sensitive transcriptional activator SoxR [Gilvimarinus sp. F26214L]|uniref:redox-sensitive transcriptional activator SoxR n=1 Tax=Gilvimarinus sp. DZF01 TaxID=3461371 RepID=UPI004045AB05
MSEAPESFVYKKELSVGAVAKRCGVAPSALHFYESKGLISSYRTAGNQRRYRRDVIRRVSLIKVAQRLGVSLEEIKTAFEQLPADKTASQKDWAKLSRQWGKQLDERIEKLRNLRAQLSDCIGCGCLSTETCPLRNPWDELARKGPGPHLL